MSWHRLKAELLPVYSQVTSFGNRAVFIILFEDLGLGRFMASSLVCLVWKCFHLTPHCGRQSVFMAVWDWFFFACPVFIISEDSFFFFLVHTKYKHLFFVVVVVHTKYKHLRIILRNTHPGYVCMSLPGTYFYYWKHRGTRTKVSLSNQRHFRIKEQSLLIL